MNDHFEPFLRGGPLAGISMVVAGVAIYCYHAASRVFGAAIPLAQAAVPGGWSWDGVSQAVTAVLMIAGGVITWLSLQWHAINRANREERIEDALAAIRIEFERQKAALAIRHTEEARRADSQDRDLADIKQAVATPPAENQPS